ncbi:MAG: hypothetical protein VYC70_09335, partial [Verrucomicrobiota bacterium]|nr:hypothetical protein [Verrucomicrobiota bacterium]
GYWAELNDIKYKLESIPGIEIKDLGFNEDVTLEDISANIYLKDKGNLTLLGLTRESFEEPKSLGLGTIGGFDIRFIGKQFMEVTNEEGDRESIKSDVAGHAINIIGGAFSEMFPFDIKNVQSLVKNYDAVLEVVSKWPGPEHKKNLKDGKGNEYNYYTLRIKNQPIN